MGEIIDVGRRQSDPDFIAQTAEPMTADEARVWYVSSAEAMRQQGAPWFRYSWDDRSGQLRLVEGWKERPEHQGEPRWQLTSVTTANHQPSAPLRAGKQGEE